MAEEIEFRGPTLIHHFESNPLYIHIVHVEPADPDLKRFSVDHDRDYIVPTLRAALTANPDLFLSASPWSPPGWMKYSNSMLGGTIRQENIPTYARYFQKFVEAYRA